MIDIKDIQGNVILSVPVTQACQKVEELMANEYIQLSWNSGSSEGIPLGAYIEHSGEKYSVLEPYTPTQKNEAEYTYTPQFKSRVMAWGKMPFFFYSGESKEPDWTLTSNPADFMKMVCDSILKETGESWTYSIDASLPASASLSFSSVDILSGLNQIASAFETEWYADKSTNTLYLGLLSHGEEVTLKVGENINVPSVQGNREGYYTRFYAFGSTRNITQDYEGSNVNNLVNKRLTLDPTKYPNGYKDIREGLSDGEIFSKVLIFDDVYPSADLSISGVRNRLMYRLDSNGDKVQVGTDDSGNPIYDQYAIWYFRIEGFDFDSSNIIEGYNLSVNFQSGALQGREFELKYYDKDTTISTSDGLTFEAKAGDYEILFVEEGSYIIPSLTGLTPSDGDSVILFNIKMPSEYTQSAYEQLEAELDKEIARMTSDLSNYSFKSNPIEFNKNNPKLSIGRKVRYVNGNYSYSTRVLKLTTQLDYPIEQQITIGNAKVKGNTQQLKEEVASANKDLNLLTVFNDMTQSIQQSYARTQQMMLEGFAAIKNIWQLKTDENGNTYAFSAFDVVSQKGMTMYADGALLNLPSIYAGLPIDDNTIYWENGVLKAKGGTEGAITSVTKDMVISALGYTPYDASNPNGYITSSALSGYATQSWVQSLGYATTSDLDSRINALINGAPSAYDTLKEIADILAGNVDSIGDIITTLGTKADKNVTISAGTGLTGGGTLAANRTLSLATSGVTAGTYKSVTVDAYGRVTGGSNPNTLAGYGITDAYTKNDITSLLGNYVTLASEQTITGKKNFTTGGLFVNGSQITYDSTNKYWKLEGDLLVTGGVTMYGNDSEFVPSTIMDAILYDDTTLGINDNGELYVKGSVGGSSTLGGLSNVGSWADSVADVDRIMYQASGSSMWVAKELSFIGLTTTELQNYLTSNNYLDTTSGDNRYLKLSGGTVKGVSPNHQYIIRLNTDNIYYTILDIQSAGVQKGYLCWTSAASMIQGIQLYNATSGDKLGLSDNGLPMYNTNTLWHSGNDGSGSGLDADLLDGVQSSGYGQYVDNLTINLNDARNGLRGGKLYNATNAYDSTDASYRGFLEYGSSGYRAQFNSSSSNNLYYRWCEANTWKPWRKVAFEDSNVASATKLQTARTIWGQSFDGTGNISGDIYTSSHSLLGTYGGAFLYSGIRSGEALSIEPLDGSGTGLGPRITLLRTGYVGMNTLNPKNRLSVYGGVSSVPALGSLVGEGLSVGYSGSYGIHLYTLTNGMGAVQCGREDGNATAYSLLLNPLGGNVGIGTPSPSAKLHVAGDILSTGGITMYSQRSLKDVVDERGLSLTELSIIKPTRYTWKDNRDSKIHIGGIADDIQQVLPEVVYKTGDGTLTMDYGNAAFAIASSLIKPVIDHEQRIMMLEEENKELRNELERLKSA